MDVCLYEHVVAYQGEEIVLLYQLQICKYPAIYRSLNCVAFC
jgi:hypothetical protein